MENSYQPQLIVCPNCAKNKSRSFLGSVTSEGFFIVKLRSHNDQLMFRSEDYSIMCDCGYQIHISCGKITLDNFASDVVLNG